MTIYAEITDGVVSNTILSDTKNEVSWVPCPKGVGIGHLYDGTNFTAYVAHTQAELDEETAAQVRYDRDYKLLTEVDPLVSNPLRWAELTSDKQTEWSQYRTDLLNVPQQSGFPDPITWPVKPE